MARASSGDGLAPRARPSPSEYRGYEETGQAGLAPLGTAARFSDGPGYATMNEGPRSGRHLMDDLPELLFAYGTLGPVDRSAASRGGWEPDAVRGRLYDLGPYPALIDPDHAEAGWVEGHVRALETSELETRLDPYEGVEERL